MMQIALCERALSVLVADYNCRKIVEKGKMDY